MLQYNAKIRENLPSMSRPGFSDTHAGYIQYPYIVVKYNIY
jgi:hypothetical protein